MATGTELKAQRSTRTPSPFWVLVLLESMDILIVPAIEGGHIMFIDNNGCQQIHIVVRLLLLCSRNIEAA